MPIFAFFVTIFVGLYATSIFGSWINWPEAGPVLAIATMGPSFSGFSGTRNGMATVPATASREIHRILRGGKLWQSLYSL